MPHYPTVLNRVKIAQRICITLQPLFGRHFGDIHAHEILNHAQFMEAYEKAQADLPESEKRAITCVSEDAPWLHDEIDAALETLFEEME